MKKVKGPVLSLLLGLAFPVLGYLFWQPEYEWAVSLSVFFLGLSIIGSLGLIFTGVWGLFLRYLELNDETPELDLSPDEKG